MVETIYVDLRVYATSIIIRGILINSFNRQTPTDVKSKTTTKIQLSQCCSNEEGPSACTESV